jgi:hypothetical protein
MIVLEILLNINSYWRHNSSIKRGLVLPSIYDKVKASSLLNPFHARLKPSWTRLLSDDGYSQMTSSASSFIDNL